MQKLTLSLFLLSLISLDGCSNSDEAGNPAEKQIADYTKKLEECSNSASKDCKGKEADGTEENRTQNLQNEKVEKGIINTPLEKLAAGKKELGDLGKQGDSISDTHEDPSRKATSRFSGEAEFPKGPNRSKVTSDIGTDAQALSSGDKQVNDISQAGDKIGDDEYTGEDFKIKSTDIFFGSIDAKVVVIEYFSFTCPHCNAFVRRIYPKIQEKYIDTGKVVYVFREFISSKQDLHAAILARCKGDVLVYKNFMLALLSQQDSWAFNKNFQELLTNVALLGGVSASEYSKCIADEQFSILLMDNTRIASKVPSFIGTPSFFINGKHFTKAYTFEELSKAIDEELYKQEKLVESEKTKVKN